MVRYLLWICIFNHLKMNLDELTEIQEKIKVRLIYIHEQDLFLFDGVSLPRPLLTE